MVGRKSLLDQYAHDGLFILPTPKQGEPEEKETTLRSDFGRGCYANANRLSSASGKNGITRYNL